MDPVHLMGTASQTMRNMEPLPTVEEIYRDEFGLDEFITSELKALVKSFRKAYEKLEGVDFSSEPMKLSSSKEIRAMAAKFLEEGIAADPRTKQKEVPAGNTLWVRAQDSYLGYRRERTKQVLWEHLGIARTKHPQDSRDSRQTFRSTESV